MELALMVDPDTYWDGLIISHLNTVSMLPFLRVSQLGPDQIEDVYRTANRNLKGGNISEGMVDYVKEVVWSSHRDQASTIVTLLQSTEVLLEKGESPEHRLAETLVGEITLGLAGMDLCTEESSQKLLQWVGNRARVSQARAATSLGAAQVLSGAAYLKQYSPSDLRQMAWPSKSLSADDQTVPGSGDATATIALLRSTYLVVAAGTATDRDWISTLDTARKSGLDRSSWPVLYLAALMQVLPDSKCITAAGQEHVVEALALLKRDKAQNTDSLKLSTELELSLLSYLIARPGYSIAKKRELDVAAQALSIEYILNHKNLVSHLIHSNSSLITEDIRKGLQKVYPNLEMNPHFDCHLVSMSVLRPERIR